MNRTKVYVQEVDLGDRKSVMAVPDKGRRHLLKGCQRWDVTQLAAFAWCAQGWPCVQP